MKVNKRSERAKEELLALRQEKSRLVKVRSTPETRAQAGRLLREMEIFRVVYVEYTEDVMGWELELLRAYPEVRAEV